MPGDPRDRGKTDLRALRHELLDADDSKVRRVVAIVDQVSNSTINQTILDTLRPRLAALRPVRPLRFGRVVLIPLDPLIVPAPLWRPGEPAVPRTILGLLVRIVRAGMGSEVTFVDNLLAGQSGDNATVTTRAGEVLWPRAAEILSAAPLPADWAESGLPPATWPPLAKAIAAVFHRAPRLWQLAQDSRTGVLELDSSVVNEVLWRDVDEPPEAYAMIVRLILSQAPHALPLLRDVASSSRVPADRTMMRQANEREIGRVVSDMEDSAGFSREIGDAGLADAAAEVRRMTTLLREVELDPQTVIRGSRLTAIRKKLDLACQARVAKGIDDTVVAPLDVAADPVDGAGQQKLETDGRDLRKLDIVARKIGDPVVYDKQLKRALDAIREAAAMGILTQIRQLRLIEILAGSEAAEVMYWEGKVPNA